MFNWLEHYIVHTFEGRARETRSHNLYENQNSTRIWHVIAGSLPLYVADMSLLLRNRGINCTQV